jgi:hypothetical protein
MRALSLWQPWATLVVVGAKRFETRGWGTNHIGPLAIHAAKSFQPECRALCDREPFRSALATGCYRMPADPLVFAPFNVCPCGHPPAAHRGVDGDGPCLSCRCPAYRPVYNPTEHAFGDWRPGRFAHRLVDPVRLPALVPYRGQQCPFDVPDGLVLGPAGAAPTDAGLLFPPTGERRVP